MKLVDKLEKKMNGNVYTNEELDQIMEKEKFYPVETEDDENDIQDSDSTENILKYTNGKSEIWIKSIFDGECYIPFKVVRSTKKSGTTLVRPFYKTSEIKDMMDYFRDNSKNKEFLVFMLGILLARRIGDTLSLKWSDFYYENGKKKDILDTLIEQKTDKVIKITVSQTVWKYLEWYCDTEKINPMEHLKEDILNTDLKIDARTKEEYEKAIKKQAASFRYELKKAADFNGLKDISTHSMRKTFGYIMHEINQFDPDCLDVLQTILGHANKETTKRYSGIFAQKGAKAFNDVGKYIEEIDAGISPVIDNIPVIALKTNDLRDIILEAFSTGRVNSECNTKTGMKILSDLMQRVEEKRLSW